MLPASIRAAAAMRRSVTRSDPSSWTSRLATSIRRAFVLSALVILFFSALATLGIAAGEGGDAHVAQHVALLGARELGVCLLLLQPFDTLAQPHIVVGDVEQ